MQESKLVKFGNTWRTIFKTGNWLVLQIRGVFGLVTLLYGIYCVLFFCLMSNSDHLPIYYSFQLLIDTKSKMQETNEHLAEQDNQIDQLESLCFHLRRLAS